MRKQSFIIEACHMPGTVVGCHLLCLGPSKGGCATTLCTDLPSATFAACSIHFVKSSGLNAKATSHYSPYLKLL